MANKFPKEFIVYSPSRASFEAMVASGEVDNTQIGIIAESGEFWENGNYHPLVMLTDYLKKTDAVALAKDLTGSIEATPEEFTFRPSAGTKSIRDESAVIRRIKGNTSVWGQYIRNPIFVEGMSYWSSINSSISVDADGSLKVQHNANSYPGIFHLLATPIPSGHKVLVIVDYKRSSATSGRCLAYLKRETASGYDTGGIDLISSARRVDAFIITTTDRIINVNVYPHHNGPVDAYSNVYSVNVFDLTQIYGAGNEPSTVEEFSKLYPDSYYPYCEPEVRSMRATGIETIGANAFDKDSVVGGLINADGTVTSNDIYSVAKIEVVPNEKYTLTNVANAVNTTYTYALYDSEDRFISVGEIKNSVTKPVSVSGDVTMPLNARYIRVVVHNDYLDSCCVNLKHSGTLTAEEATYFKEVRMLPDIAKYFPDGMHGIGEVYDEINEENAVKRFGVRAYEDGDNDNADVITDGTNTVYVLDEPIVTPITEPLQWDYKVADFGTEKMLSNLPSSPFRADIVYQFNAADRIRDNARNIERLEEYTKNMATMEDIINAIPTEIATATQLEEYTVTDGSQLLYPNIMYEYSIGGIGATGSFVMPNIVIMANRSYDHQWMLRLPSIATSEVLTFPYTIKWQNGIAPNFTEACTLEIYLKEIYTGEIIGEWKFYPNI